MKQIDLIVSGDLKVYRIKQLGFTAHFLHNLHGLARKDRYKIQRSSRHWQTSACRVYVVVVVWATESETILSKNVPRKCNRSSIFNRPLNSWSCFLKRLIYFYRQILNWRIWEDNFHRNYNFRRNSYIYCFNYGVNVIGSKINSNILLFSMIRIFFHQIQNPEEEKSIITKVFYSYLLLRIS